MKRLNIFPLVLIAKLCNVRQHQFVWNLISFIGSDWEETSSDADERQMVAIMNGEDWDREVYTYWTYFNDDELQQLNGQIGSFRSFRKMNFVVLNEEFYIFHSTGSSSQFEKGDRSVRRLSRSGKEKQTIVIK